MSVGAQRSGEAVCKNQRERGARGSPESVVRVSSVCGGARMIAGGLGAFLSVFVGGNGREGEVIL